MTDRIFFHGTRRQKAVAGEEMACRWLQQKGFTLLHQNYRVARFEIDLIMQKGQVIHCIEVRTRQYSAFGWPEQSIRAKKKRNMQMAAQYYLWENNVEEQVQIDVIAVTLFHHRLMIQWFENVQALLP